MMQEGNNGNIRMHSVVLLQLKNFQKRAIEFESGSSQQTVIFGNIGFEKEGSFVSLELFEIPLDPSGGHQEFISQRLSSYRGMNMKFLSRGR